MNLDGLRPPMKVGVNTDDLGHGLQRETPLGLDGLRGWATSASAPVKAAMERVGSSSQNVRPEWGWTKAYR